VDNSNTAYTKECKKPDKFRTKNNQFLLVATLRHWTRVQLCS